LWKTIGGINSEWEHGFVVKVLCYDYYVFIYDAMNYHRYWHVIVRWIVEK